MIVIIVVDFDSCIVICEDGNLRKLFLSYFYTISEYREMCLKELGI